MPILDKSLYQLSLNEIYLDESISGFQFSPDGKQISFLFRRHSRVEDVTTQEGKKLKTTFRADISMIPKQGGYPRFFTNSGDVGNPSVWSPDGNWLAIERSGQLQIINVSSGESRTIYRGSLFFPRLGIGDAYLGYPSWSPDAKFILFATREATRTTLRLISVDGRLQRELFSVDGYIIGWDLSPDGHQVLIVTRGEDGWVGDVRLLDIESGEVSILWNENNYEYQKPVATWSKDGKQIVFRSNRSGWAKLWVIALGDNEPKPLTLGTWDDYAFRFSPKGDQVVFSSRSEQDGSGDDLWVLNLSENKPKRLTHHLGINVPLAWSDDDLVYYWHSSPTESGDLWVVGSAGDNPRQLTWSVPISLERKLSVPQDTVIMNDDGTKVPSLIYLPKYFQEGEKYPAIVWIHGGPTMISRLDFAPQNNWLANQGYIVIVPNFRGSVGYGVDHMAAIAGDGLGKNDLSDVLAAGKFARTLTYVDLSRGIGVGGRSWGGYLTLMAVTQAPEEFSCAVAGAAISDWFIQQSGTEVRYYDRWLVGGWVYEQLDRARQRSPITFVERIKTPLFIFHGEEDRDVPFSQIEAFVKKAKQAAVNLEYKAYPIEEHSNKKPENQQDMLDRMQNFYRQHLYPWNVRDNPVANQIQY